MVQTLRDELDPLPLNKDLNYSTLADLPYLNAVITEAMRVHPPIPGGFPRLTPPGGIDIDEVHIPGGVTVVAPNYSIARCMSCLDCCDNDEGGLCLLLGVVESCFEDANAFRPERWCTAPEMVKNRDAVAPFSIGKSPNFLPLL